MKNLLRSLNERPIAYYKLYRHLTGSTTAGILLSQLMYWFFIQDKVYKTDADIMAETLLTENELRTAKKKIKELDFISVTREGVPAKTYYRISWERYKQTVGDKSEQLAQSSLVESTELDSLNPLNCTSEIHGTITENTAETTDREKEKYIVSNDSSAGKQTVEKKTTPFPPPTKSHEEVIKEFNMTQERVAAVNEWLAYKKARKDKFLPMSLRSLLKRLAYLSDAEFIEAVESSIGHGWSGLFAAKKKNSGGGVVCSL